MENNLISIIIPIYNSEKTIKRCLESIINQTYRNIEIILIDDGSEDDSYKICKEYQQNDNRIVLKSQKNSGVSKARNTGLDIAKGRYIGFVDSDDFIDKNMYELLVKEMEEKGCKLSICNYYFENLQGHTLKSYNSQSIIFSSRELLMKMYNNLSINGFICNKLYDRSLIYYNNTHLNLNEEIGMLEDNLFNYNIFDKNEEFTCSFISEKLYHYIQNTNSTCNIKYNDKNLQQFIVRDKQICILRKNQMDFDFLMADYIVNFTKTKIKYKILKIKKNELYRIIENNYKLYKKQIDIRKLNSRIKLKYILSRYFSFIFWMYIIFKKENI